MGERIDVRGHLREFSRGGAEQQAIADTICVIADIAARVSTLVGQGPLAWSTGDDSDESNIEARADALFMAGLGEAPVAVAASKREPDARAMNSGAPLAVAIDSLDGASNIDANVSVGTIFSIYRAASPAEPSAAPVMRAGAEQLAAGFTMYGPHTALIMSVGDGAHGFALDREAGTFVLTRAGLSIPPGKREYAINASNYWHWDEAVRAYIDACISAAGAMQHEDFNMRWIGTLAAEAFRVLSRGGVFLYPRDDRPGYEQGRFQLVYEANPIAYLMEQAGGAATDDHQRILDIVPKTLHQQVPLVFGSRDEVERVANFHRDPHTSGERSPLFGRRGLFRT